MLEQPTKLRRILFEEQIKLNKLYQQITNQFYPGVHMYKLSQICSGKHENCYISTYIKILHALNTITDKKYTLEEIIEDTIVENDLK
jgi:hypothetical protein